MILGDLFLISLATLKCLSAPVPYCGHLMKFCLMARLFDFTFPESSLGGSQLPVPNFGSEPN